MSSRLFNPCRLRDRRSPAVDTHGFLESFSKSWDSPRSDLGLQDDRWRSKFRQSPIAFRNFRSHEPFHVIDASSELDDCASRFSCPSFGTSSPGMSSICADTTTPTGDAAFAIQFANRLYFIFARRLEKRIHSKVSRFGKSSRSSPKTVGSSTIMLIINRAVLLGCYQIPMSESVTFLTATAIRSSSRSSSKFASPCMGMNSWTWREFCHSAYRRSSLCWST